MPQPLPDPVIDEIREIRHRISARFDHDPQRLLEHYMQLQEEYRDRLLDDSEAADRSAPDTVARADR